MLEAADILRVLGAAFGAWLAVRVELRWLRADQKRTEQELRDHNRRIRALELGD